MTVDDLLTKWLGREGGAERANYQMFLTELTQALGLPTPDPKGAGLGDYQFEAPVKSAAVFGGKHSKRIDLYKRDHFILEAKQSQLKPGEALPDEPEAPPPEPVRDLFGAIIGHHAPTGRAVPRYDRLMADARVQAERYALALPDAHRTPPFLIVADIGRSFELYFDWSGNGRGYGPFPDERRYRVRLEDLASAEPLGGLDLTPADLLRAIWTAPASVDPRLKAAAVTRDIALRLSRVAAALEDEQRKLRPGDAEVALGIEATSLFLMRVLFCMFAEDVELLPKDSFKNFLSEAKDKSPLFWRNGLADLWSKMNDRQEVNRFWLAGDAVVRYFNGNLFSDVRIFDLAPEFKNELLVAARQDWRSVEPAIFGTLLEQVLTAADRAKLGAHYTPRAYVERLVQATVMDVLSAEWEAVREEARGLAEGRSPRAFSARPELVEERPSLDTAGRPSTGSGRTDENRAPDPAAAIALACGFHARLVAVRVLDPACGTGNFLYVAMEQLLRLESEVRQFVVGLGGELAPAVHPNQFLGLELNPRAAVIAELVLWIGWLRYRLANTPEAIGEPVLPPLSNINGGTHGGFDAVLVRTLTGEPDVATPRRPVWPEADFIVGNPPFIGGKDLRERLGGEYAEALWAANPHVPKSADFVMQWWDRAADLLTRPGTRLKRFGLVTTNSITQVFSRRVIERWLAAPPPQGEGDRPAQPGGGGAADLGDAPVASAPPPPAQAPAVPLPASGEDQRGKLHLVLAVPDHPWTRVTRDAAAVRIAMTVAAAGAGEGRLVRIVGERGIDTDAPVLDEVAEHGLVNADLSVGTDVTGVVSLKANQGLTSRGVATFGEGFIVTPDQARAIGLGTRPGLEQHIRDYRNGRDLLQRARDVMVVDLFGLTETDVMDRFPEVYQHLLRTVKPERDKNNRATRRNKWWLFGEMAPAFRDYTAALPSYICTPETSKHRLFMRMDATVLPDNTVVNIGSDSAFLLGVLSSRLHGAWVLERGGWLGVGNDNRYSKSLVFDPYPFPDHSDVVATVADRLDQTRRTALTENPALTMTGLYNLVEEVRASSAGSAPLPPEREAAVVRARARIVAKLHDDLDQAVADAYGWGEEWQRAPLPPGEIVARLVRLNAERAAEEKAGLIRWLRPDYQQPRFG